IRSEFADRSMQELSKYRSADSPYAAVMERAEQIRQQTDAQAVGPEVIARVVDHAIEARTPRPRYMAPFRTKFLLVLRALLPTRWLDAIVRKLMGLDGRPRARLPRAT